VIAVERSKCNDATRYTPHVTPMRTRSKRAKMNVTNATTPFTRATADYDAMPHEKVNH